MNDEQVKPEVGMGCTRIMWTDKVPYTIVKVESDKRIVVQRDSVEAEPGEQQMGHQKWVIKPNPYGEVLILTKRRNGMWIERNKAMSNYGFVVGHRRYYYDWSF